MEMSPGSSCCGQARPSWRARKSSPGSLMGLVWAMPGSGQTPGCGARCWGGEWSSPWLVLGFSPWLGTIGNESEYLRICQKLFLGWGDCVQLGWGNCWERGNMMGVLIHIRGQQSPFGRGMKAQPLTPRGSVAAGLTPPDRQLVQGRAVRGKGLKPGLQHRLHDYPGRLGGLKTSPQMPLGFGWSLTLD